MALVHSRMQANTKHHFLPQSDCVLPALDVPPASLQCETHSCIPHVGCRTLRGADSESERTTHSQTHCSGVFSLSLRTCAECQLAASIGASGAAQIFAALVRVRTAVWRSLEARIGCTLVEIDAHNCLCRLSASRCLAAVRLRAHAAIPAAADVGARTVANLRVQAPVARRHRSAVGQVCSVLSALAL